MSIEEEEFKSNEEMVQQNSRLLLKINILQTQLSSIMDWLGRAMIDYTPHMMSEVHEMNEDLKEFGV